MTTPARFNPWARRRLLACSFTCALAGMAAATVATVALAPARIAAIWVLASNSLAVLERMTRR